MSENKSHFLHINDNDQAVFINQEGNKEYRDNVCDICRSIRGGYICNKCDRLVCGQCLNLESSKNVICNRCNER